MPIFYFEIFQSHLHATGVFGTSQPVHYSESEHGTAFGNNFFICNAALQIFVKPASTCILKNDLVQITIHKMYVVKIFAII